MKIFLWVLHKFFAIFTGAADEAKVIGKFMRKYVDNNGVSVFIPKSCILATGPAFSCCYSTEVTKH